MAWLKSFTLGAAAFVAVHAGEVYRWRDWFDSADRYKPWFLNTGPSAGAAVLVFAVAGACASALWARDGVDAGLQAFGVAAGAALAMTITLFVIGPGNIFPIGTYRRRRARRSQRGAGRMARIPGGVEYQTKSA